MKVSIVIPTFNHEKYIAEALNSILMQRVNFDYEVIVGEDCSTDGTRNIVLSYCDKFPSIIKPVLHQQNVGGPKNTLTCLEKCRGEYLIILEGDDYWTNEHKLQMQADYLDVNQDCSYCFHNALIKYEDNEQSDKLFLSKTISNSFHNKKLGIHILLNRNYVPAAARMYRRQILMNLPPIIDEIMTADWLINILALKMGYAGYIDEVMSVYRIHSDGMARNRINIHAGAIKMFKYLYSALDSTIHPELDKCIENTSESLAEELLVKISRDIQDENYADLAPLFSQASSIFSEYPAVLQNLRQKKLLESGNKALAVGDFAKAEGLLREALRMGRASEEITCSLVLALGNCYRHSGRLDEEKNLYVDEISSGKFTGANKFGPILRLARVLTDCEDYSAAESMYKECLSINNISESQRSDALIALSICLKRQLKYSEAEKILTRLNYDNMLIDAQKYYVGINLADIKRNTSYPYDAINLYNSCFNIPSLADDQYVNLVLSVGSCYSSINNDQLAEKVYLEALNKKLSSKQYFEVYMRLASLYQKYRIFDKFNDVLEAVSRLSDLSELDRSAIADLFRK